jgi:hypothetical protein
VINEVDQNFPKNNNLILFIDQKGFLEAEKTYITNNFELIIINPIYRPEEVFAYLGKRLSGQVLRRIFNPFFSCEVYEIKTNYQQLQEILRKKMMISMKEF